MEKYINKSNISILNTISDLSFEQLAFLIKDINYLSENAQLPVNSMIKDYATDINTTENIPYHHCIKIIIDHCLYVASVHFLYLAQNKK